MPLGRFDLVLSGITPTLLMISLALHVNSYHQIGDVVDVSVLSTNLALLAFISSTNIREQAGALNRCLQRLCSDSRNDGDDSDYMELQDNNDYEHSAMNV